MAWSTLLHLFNPQAIVIGGGAMRLGDTLLGPARQIIRQHVLHADFTNNRLLRRARFHEDMCLVGAALHAKLQVHKRKA